MTLHASGSFHVTLTPQPDSTLPAEPPTPLARLTIDKQFEGDLVAVSRGQMLSAMTPVQNSAGYVAIERVTGTLHGRRGSFVLQHIGIMDHGKGDLTVMVVPDSGTDELTGLIGRMDIDVSSGDHRYTFTYTLPDQA